MAFCTAADNATSPCVVIAPMVTLSAVTVMPVRPRAARSTTVLGLFKRCFRTGMKV